MELTTAVLEKCKLENTITMAIRQFEVATGLEVYGIQIDHKSVMNHENKPVTYVYEVNAMIDVE